MGRISGFLSAAPGDQLRLLLAAALLHSLRSVFAIGGFARVRRGLIGFSEQVARLVPGNPTPVRIVSAVEVADRRLPGDRTCLIRSSTAEVILCLYGFSPAHRIGVAKEDNGAIAAHSWLELDGDVIIGELDDLARFDPLPSLGAADLA